MNPAARTRRSGVHPVFAAAVVASSFLGVVRSTALGLVDPATGDRSEGCGEVIEAPGVWFGHNDQVQPTQYGTAT